jgi:hypothetical protein
MMEAIRVEVRAVLGQLLKAQETGVEMADLARHHHRSLLQADQVIPLQHQADLAIRRHLQVVDLRKARQVADLQLVVEACVLDNFFNFLI